jgi:hypothetical protein
VALARLPNHRLNTLSDQLLKFLSASTSATRQLQCTESAGLLHYVRDLDTDCVITMADLGALQESWIDDTGHAMNIDGYNCVKGFKRPDIKAAL